MARKPSIFSSNYERRMKKRRRRILYIIAIVFLSLGIVFMICFNSSDSIRNNINKRINSIKSSFSKEKPKEDKKVEKKVEDKNVEKNAEDKKVEDEKKEKEENKKIDVKLKSGNTVKLEIEEKNNDKVIKAIELDQNAMNYNLSPSGKNAIIYENNNQTINYVDIDGKIEDITYKEYKSSKGTKFKKEVILAQDKEYIWTTSPKFIDEENIAYLSNLPWFNKKNRKYIWIYNIKEKTYKKLEHNGNEVFGNNVELKELTDEGLEVLIDNKTKYITSKGITE